MKHDKLDIYLESIEDISSNKIIAMADRREVKDFVDIYFICKKTELDFNEILFFANEKLKEPYEYLLKLDRAENLKEEVNSIDFLEKFDFNDYVMFFNNCSKILEQKGIDRIWKNLEN